MNYLGANLDLEESCLKPGFLDYLRQIEKDPDSKLRGMIFASCLTYGQAVPYFLKRCNSVWNGDGEYIEKHENNSRLLSLAIHDEDRASRFPAPPGTVVRNFRFNSP